MNMVIKEIEFKVVVSVYEDESVEYIKETIARGIDKVGLGYIDIVIGDTINEYEDECL